MSEPIGRRQFAALALAPIALEATDLLPALAAPAINPPRESVMAALPRMMEVAGTPGVAIGVIQEAKLVWSQQRGLMDSRTGQAVTESTMFPAASLSKPVFTFGALQLVDEGKLDLDRPLKAYVPDHAPVDPRTDQITARHVLSHASGLRNWRNSADQPLTSEFVPGARFQYSGEGFYYLQRAVEHITGQGFEQFMQSRVLQPLGMSSSTYLWRPDAAERLASGHRAGVPGASFARDFGSRLYQSLSDSTKPMSAWTHEEVVGVMQKMSPAPAILPNFLLPNGAASLLTTMADYSKFLIRFLAAPRPEMLKPQTRINSALSWALGLGVETEAGRTYSWHWGDNGNWKNFVLIHPESRSAITVFTNGAGGMKIAERLVNSASGHDHAAWLWL